MDCSQIKEMLSSFNDREAGPEEVHAVKEHLHTCKECAFESTMIVGMKRLLGHWDGVRASQNFHADLMERVEREPKPGLLSRVHWRPVGIGVGAGAAAAAVVAVLWFVIPGADRGTGAGTGEERTEEAGAAAAPAAPAGAPGDRSEPVAHVLVQEGTLRIRRSGGVESLGSVGDALSSGDSMRVSAGGEVELDIGGGLRLRLVAGPSGTAAEFAIGEGPSEAELVSGTALLSGEAGAREGDAYSVKAGPALVSLPKRELLAAVTLAEDGSLEVVVARGRSEVMLPSGVQVLNAGQALGVAPDGEPASPPGPAEEAMLKRLWGWGKR